MRRLIGFLLGIGFFIILSRTSVAYFTEEFNSGFSNPDSWNVNTRSGSINFTASHLQLLRNPSSTTSFPFISNSLSTVPATGEFSLEFKFNYLSVGNFGDGIAVTHLLPPLDLNLAPNHKNHIQFLIWQDPRGLQLYTTLCPTINPTCSQTLTLLNGPSTAVNFSEHILKLNYSNDGQYTVYFDDLDTPLYLTSPNQARPLGLWLGSPEKTNSTDLWSSFQIDYYKVSQAVLGEENTLPVPDLKQYDPQWGGGVYDHAMRWSPSNPTITRWGCALVSAAMILNYFNHSINPADLNTWLVNQPDGYIRNGLLNWLAVSRYSKLNRDVDSPNLEFTKAQVNDELLDSSLAEEKPVILGQTGHYVVATGKSSDSYSINDPGYSDRPTLESYGNSYLSQGIYTPSNTDLSYIMLVVNEDVEIEVQNQDGDVVGDSYVEKLSDATNPSVSSEGLNTYLFSKPPAGNYFVSLSGGGGIFTLDAYVYDEEGNVILENFNGIASDQEQIKIVIGEENEIRKIVTIDSILADLEKLKEMGLVKEQGYKLIKNQLVTLKNLSNKSGGALMVRLWKSALIKQVEILSPKFLTEEAAVVLTDGLVTLRSN